MLYTACEVALLRKVRRLTQDLGVNLAGVVVILRLTEESARTRSAAAQPRQPAAPEDGSE